MSVFNVSVLLLTMNFVMTLSKKSADPDFRAGRVQESDNKQTKSGIKEKIEL